MNLCGRGLHASRLCRCYIPVHLDSRAITALYVLHESRSESPPGRPSLLPLDVVNMIGWYLTTRNIVTIHPEECREVLVGNVALGSRITFRSGLALLTRYDNANTSVNGIIDTHRNQISVRFTHLSEGYDVPISDTDGHYEVEFAHARAYAEKYRDETAHETLVREYGQLYLNLLAELGVTP